MFDFLTKGPGRMSWIEIALIKRERRENYVGGRLERVSLLMNIDIWMDEKYIEHPVANKLNLIVKNGEDVRLICGNIFLASTDKAGQVISLSEDQKKWLGEHQTVICCSDKSFLMLIDCNAVTRVAEGSGV